jgi:hypothetical protein
MGKLTTTLWQRERGMDARLVPASIADAFGNYSIAPFTEVGERLSVQARAVQT